MSQHILLVQSDMRVAQPLARYFKQRGDEVWQAWELGQALALVNQVHPDLMLMDLHFQSQDWSTFLRQAREIVPDMKVIMTNKFPDLQRELFAREQGVTVFLRQPFSPRWIEQAIERVNAPLVESAGPIPRAPLKPKPVRMPVRVKITLPYLLLALVFALAGAYLVSRLLLESVQDRYLNQLIGTARQDTDWMVREEDRLLESLRLMANSSGVAEALAAANAESLRLLALPLAANAGVSELHLLNNQGVAVLSLVRDPNSTIAGYSSSTGGKTFVGLDFINRVLAGYNDASGDKFAGRAPGSRGETFYVAGPVLDGNGMRVGAVLIGRPLSEIAEEMKRTNLGEVTLYDREGQSLASTLYTAQEIFPIAPVQAQEVLLRQDQASLTRDLTISTVSYTEILGPWEARNGGDLGIIGVAQPQAFLVRTSQATQTQIFILVAAAIFLVIMIGLLLANLITRPLLRLVDASSKVAQGNLEVKVDAGGDDEVAVLAQSFNYMIAGLQEGSIYRDLLGRTVSPEVREQLRQTFTSGELRLEGQRAIATVLMTDIRGFTSLSEKADPAAVFHWLNEYFGHLVPVVTRHGGVVNKFDGDAMLAFFGTLPRPLSPQESAMAACQAAIEMLQEVDALNRQREARGDPPMVTGFGVHTGVVMAGGLGTSDRLHYTIIGDTVNTTQRLESLTRDFFDCSAVLVSHSTFIALGEENQKGFSFAPFGQHQVKGKQEQVQVYWMLPAQQAGVRELKP